MSDLPDGWEWATLDDVAEIQGGIQKQQRRRPVNNKYPFLRVANVLRGQLDLREVHEVELFEGELDKYLLQPGDLLVVEGNGSIEQIGRGALWNGAIEDCVHQNHLIRVRPYDGMDPHYLNLLWNSPATIEQLKEKAWSTSGLYTLSVSKLKAIRLPVPPHAEQRRIVDTVEDHLSRLDAGELGITRGQKRLRTIRISTMRRLLRGIGVPADLSMGTADDVLATARGETNTETPVKTWPIPDLWRWSSIGQLFRVFVGATPKRSVATNWVGSVPWVSSGEVSFCRITSTREYISEEALGNRSTRYHPPGTVLLAMIGEGKTRGQAAILDIGAAHNQNCASIRVSETAMLPDFVYAVLEERYQETRHLSSGGNQLALNSSRVREIPMPVPPLATQHYIVERIAELVQLENRLMAALRVTRARAAQLRRSLLTEAFDGRLVPQDPADESASVLLERIRAKHAAQLTPKRARRINPTQEILL